MEVGSLEEVAWTPAMGNDYGPVPESHHPRPESDCPNRTIHWYEKEVVLIMSRKCSSYMEMFDFRGIVFVATKHRQELDARRMLEIFVVHLCATNGSHYRFLRAVDMPCTGTLQLLSEAIVRFGGYLSSFVAALVSYGFGSGMLWFTC